MKRIIIIAALLGALSLTLFACSQESSSEFEFGYKTPFQIDDMEYTITSIKPVEDDYPNFGIHNGIMRLEITCKALEDGAKPNLEYKLTMYDSSGHENDQVLGGGNYETGVGALKAGAEASFEICYGYDYEEPWYELQVSKTNGGDPAASYKFSIDPQTLSVSEAAD